MAVFLDPLDGRWAQLDRLVGLWVRFIDEMGTFIHAEPYAAGTYGDPMPLTREIR